MVNFITTNTELTGAKEGHIQYLKITNKILVYLNFLKPNL